MKVKVCVKGVQVGREGKAGAKTFTVPTYTNIIITQRDMGTNPVLGKRDKE